MAPSEFPVTIEVAPDALVLEGLWQPGSGRAGVIAPPHPEYGGSFDNPVVSEVAFALESAGCASLRCNWRGVGASQGRPTGDWRAADADFAAAVDQLDRTVPAPLFGAGYSFGAAAALRFGLADSRLRSLLLVAPPVSMLRKLPIERFRGPICVIVGDEDVFAPADQLSELLSSRENVRLDVIQGVDHFFSGPGLSEVRRLARGALG